MKKLKQKNIDLNKLSIEKLAKVLGYNYIYHYNEYTNKWQCTHREHFNCLFGDESGKEYVMSVGNTLKEAMVAMILIIPSIQSIIKFKNEYNNKNLKQKTK